MHDYFGHTYVGTIDRTPKHALPTGNTFMDDFTRAYYDQGHYQITFKFEPDAMHAGGGSVVVSNKRPSGKRGPTMENSIGYSVDRLSDPARLRTSVEYAPAITTGHKQLSPGNVGWAKARASQVSGYTQTYYHRLELRATDCAPKSNTPDRLTQTMKNNRLMKEVATFTRTS